MLLLLLIRGSGLRMLGPSQVNFHMLLQLWSTEHDFYLETYFKRHGLNTVSSKVVMRCHDLLSLHEGPTADATGSSCLGRLRVAAFEMKLGKHLLV